MSFEDFDILNALNKEQEDEDYQLDEKYIKRKEMGYDKVVEQRKSHKQALKERLSRLYRLNDNEINELFKIITHCEEKIDKIKDEYNFEKAQHGDAEKMKDKMLEFQQSMKKEFNKELIKILKKKTKK